MLRLRQLSQEIADGYLDAEQARVQAKYAYDPAVRKEALETERRWIGLARSLRIHRKPVRPSRTERSKTPCIKSHICRALPGPPPIPRCAA